MSFLSRPPFTKIGLVSHLNQYSVISPAIMSTHAHLASSSRRSCVPIEPEIVDDSEPERIEYQKTLKKRLKTSAETLHSPRIIAHNNDHEHVDEIPVIEISGKNFFTLLRLPANICIYRFRFTIGSFVFKTHENTRYGCSRSRSSSIHKLR